MAHEPQRLAEVVIAGLRQQKPELLVRDEPLAGLLAEVADLIPRVVGDDLAFWVGRPVEERLGGPEEVVAADVADAADPDALVPGRLTPLDPLAFGQEPRLVRDPVGLGRISAIGRSPKAARRRA